MRILLLLLLLIMSAQGCIRKVQWIQRKGGQPEQLNWVPICPSCKHVVDYQALQCKNPDCRSLLTWTDKIIYADATAIAKLDSSHSERVAPLAEPNKKNSITKTPTKLNLPAQQHTPKIQKQLPHSTTPKKSQPAPAVEKKGEKSKENEDDWNLEDDNW